MKSWSLRNLVGLALLSLLLAVGHTPAHAQDFTIQDASYVVTDNEGDEGGYEGVLFQVFIQTPEDGYYDEFAYDYLPAVYIAPYQYCDCSQSGDYVVDPWYTYTDYCAYGYDDNTWLDTVEYDIYVADSTDAEPCDSGACSCSGGVEGYPYLAYYAPLEEDIYVTV